jgi:hypothetical protein
VITKTIWVYQERHPGCDWEDIEEFENKDEALQHWATTFADGWVDARLIEREYIEAPVHFRLADGSCWY